MALTTDVTPRIHLEPSKVLKDEHRVKRLIAALSGVIFYDVDEAKASEILQECLKVCGGSKDTLAQVLQNEFFGGHTPFYWAITNKNPQSHSSPLLKELLLYGEPLGRGAQNDIVAAFRLEFDSILYEAIRHRLIEVDTLETYSASFFQGEEYNPVLTVSSHDASVSNIRFEIPKFFDRLLVDTKLSLRFYALGTTFCLTAAMIQGLSARPRWEFYLSEIPPSGRRAMATCATLEVHPGVGGSGHERYYDTQCMPRMHISDSDLEGFYINTYTANERGALSGTITLCKA